GRLRGSGAAGSGGVRGLGAAGLGGGLGRGAAGGGGGCGGGRARAGGGGGRVARARGGARRGWAAGGGARRGGTRGAGGGRGSGRGVIGAVTGIGRSVIVRDSVIRLGAIVNGIATGPASAGSPTSAIASRARTPRTAHREASMIARAVMTATGRSATGVPTVI